VTIRLLIADDHQLVREGLRMTFEGTDVQIIAEAADGQQAFETLKKGDVDVALVDISMPRADGFRFLELTRQAGLTVPVVMHSVHDGYLRRSRDLGAQGFVLKGQEKSVLVSAVLAASSGEEYWSCPSSH